MEEVLGKGTNLMPVTPPTHSHTHTHTHTYIHTHEILIYSKRFRQVNIHMKSREKSTHVDIYTPESKAL